VLPHELTYPKPVEDRMKLLDACNASFDQVFMIYNDPSMQGDKLLEKVMKGDPAISVHDDNKVRHSLWMITDQGSIDELNNMMKDKKAIIADGHHRYETAKRFLRSRGEAFDYTMVYFANAASDLPIMPIHRLFKKSGHIDINKLAGTFEVKQVHDPKDMIPMLSSHKNVTAFGVLANNICAIIVLKDPRVPEEVILDQHHPEWKKLDVTVLHRIILPRLGIGEKDNLNYTVNFEEAQKKIASGEAQLAFFLNSTRIDQIITIAEARGLMPQKSTFFYPKLLSGLVMRQY
ncbi:MAG: DUF1015 family protein, partial [bacterium]